MAHLSLCNRKFVCYIVRTLKKPRLKENNFPSFKKDLKISGIKFGFNLRENELRNNFNESFEHLSKFKVDFLRTDFPMDYYYKPDFKFSDKIVLECKKRKIKLLFVLGSGMSSTTVNTPKNEQEANKFVRLVSKIAKRYKGKVIAYEIWNEPEFPYFWRGNFKDFIEILKRSSFVIKKETPETFVGFNLASISNFDKYFEKIASNQTLSNIDFFGMHGYPGTLEPGDFKAYGKRISYVRKTLKKTGCNIQIWVTEFGFVAFDSTKFSSHTPKNQTNFLRQSCKIFKENKVPVVIWYRMRDAPITVLFQKIDPFENRFGLLKKDFKPKDSRIFKIIRERSMFK